MEKERKSAILRNYPLDPSPCQFRYHIALPLTIHKFRNGYFKGFTCLLKYHVWPLLNMPKCLECRHNSTILNKVALMRLLSHTLKLICSRAPPRNLCFKRVDVSGLGGLEGQVRFIVRCICSVRYGFNVSLLPVRRDWIGWGVFLWSI